MTNTFNNQPFGDTETNKFLV